MKSLQHNKLEMCKWSCHKAVKGAIDSDFLAEIVFIQLTRYGNKEGIYVCWWTNRTFAWKLYEISNPLISIWMD